MTAEQVLNEMQSLANRLFEEAEEKAQEHFNADEWDDDVVYGEYVATIYARTELQKKIDELKAKVKS